MQTKPKLICFYKKRSGATRGAVAAALAAAAAAYGSMPAARSLASSSATLFLSDSTSLDELSIDALAPALGVGASAGREPERT
jgi:hypothetical protein